jgi:transcriptional regulator with XRE-family HTH domain
MRGHSKQIRARFGLTIRNLRHRQRLTQEELARRAFLHRTYLTDIERGTRNPSLEAAEKLAMGLGMSLSQLFRYVETDKPSLKLYKKRG